MDPDTDQQPSRIGDRFEVDRLIARGGMSAVYLARQVDVGRDVALKVLRAQDPAEGIDDFDERFRVEARTLASLNHPNIVTLYDFGKLPDGRCYLAMEFIDGPRLSDELKHGPMDASRAVLLISQVCRAVAHAHRKGVVHRDLKPSNLLIRREPDGGETVKVVDFGLVKLTDTDQSLTRDGNVLGSPHCMAPEQVRGGDIDGRTDIYAIGVLLFRSLTGRYPFHGPTAAATMMAHLNEATPTFHQVDPRLQPPEGLESVVRRCLEKDPDRRFANIGDLLAALRPYLDPGAEVSSTDVFSATLVRTEPKIVEVDQRAERGLLMVALSLGAVGLGLAGVWWMLQSSPQRPPEAAPAVATSAPAVAPPPDPPVAAAATAPVQPSAPAQEATPPPPVAPASSAAPPAPAKAKPSAARPKPKPAAPTAPQPTAEPPPAGYKGVPDDL